MKNVMLGNKTIDEWNNQTIRPSCSKTIASLFSKYIMFLNFLPIINLPTVKNMIQIIDNTERNR